MKNLIVCVMIGVLCYFTFNKSNAKSTKITSEDGLKSFTPDDTIFNDINSSDPDAVELPPRTVKPIKRIKNTEKNLISIDFEGNDLASNGLKPSGNLASITTEKAFSGQQSIKIVLNKSNKVSYRTEFVLEPKSYPRQFRYLDYGKEYWVGFAIYLDKNYQAPLYSDIMFQIHGRPDKHLKEAFRNPSLSLSITGKKQYDKDPSWQISSVGDSKKLTVNKNYTSRTINQVSPIKGDIGRWVKWVVHFKSTYNKDGFIELYKDGKKIFKRAGMATVFNDRAPGYFKLGTYKWSWKSRHSYETIKPAQRTHYLDALKIAIGPNRYNDVAP